MAAEARRNARLVTRTRHARDSPLWLIGGFKLAKGVALLAVALGAHHLIHEDIADVVAKRVARLTAPRFILIGINVAVVWYLTAVLRRPVQKGRVRP